MLNKNTLHYFAKEADILFSRNVSGNSPLTAYGLYAGLPDGMSDDDLGPASQRASQRLGELLRSEGSVQRAKAKYLEENPEHFITAAFLREGAPKQKLMGRLKGIFGVKDKIHESASKSYQARMKEPRAFIRSGRSGGYHQDAFYNEVRRGLYDDELDQIHVPKKGRTVYM